MLTGKISKSQDSDCQPCVETEPGSPLLTESYILTLKHVSYISNSLPLQYKEYSWVCSYSLVRDGKSYATLYKKIKGHIGSLLIIKDSSGTYLGDLQDNHGQ